ncbi:cell division FtsA domain-containing protein [Symbiobacterium thermophilum]|uniref:ATPase n=1 Tax=Symbiobacterium thermophilum TaxID=2734 RepID=A0A953LFX5_SYMTR|nr:cell division FtsA domain-containing protein [Symbiobacterium thermophilum]MBY6274671.1 ATPase [Symbiobacterium thermophilum]
MSGRPLLTLDIGTRKVAGLVTVTGRKGLRIVAAEVMEHATRAMLDGQIHDVAAVAEVVARIVARLEKRTGESLREVAVAAAGRALRTVRGRAQRQLSGLTQLSADDVFSLELEAVQAAQTALSEVLREGERPQDYHYVGHSVTQSVLDGFPLTHLVGQRGSAAEIEVIATFLPRGVVDSLQAVLEICNLEMVALTLEPIAALSVAVPESMRHLNLALVDIGAGTSDIALTARGAVLAYDMVPIAGDEITEALSEAFLLDFNVGEAVKRKTGSAESVTFTDILGQTLVKSRAELVEAMQPAARRLAGQIARRILALNGGQAPQAVLLVGGGSLTPGLTEYVAAELGLPHQRVAVRGRDAIAGVEGARNLLRGPDAITPIGIAVAARDHSTLGFSYVYVNGGGVRLFRPGRLTVADALLAAGISIRELQGSVGKGLTVTVNGQLRMVPGTFGKPARILVNGEPAGLEAPVQHHDRIDVEPGTPGQPGRATVAEVAPEAAERLTVTLDGTVHTLAPLVTVNGEPSGPDRELRDNDVVVVRPLRTVGDVLAALGYDDPSTGEVIRYTLNGSPGSIVWPRRTVLVNGLSAGADALEMPVHSGDRLEIRDHPPLTAGELAERLGGGRAIRIRLNGEQYKVPAGGLQVMVNGLPAGPSDPLRAEDQIVVTVRDEPPIFANLLVAAGVTPTPPPGKRQLVMRLNGQEAEFVTPISDGDDAEIEWI